MMAASESTSFRCERPAHLQADEVRLLAAVGFMAARAGLNGLAIRIFEGLSVIRPDADFPRIGILMSHIAIGDAEKALQYVAACCAHRLPFSPELRALQALSLKLLGRAAEASELIDTVIDDAGYSPKCYPIAATIIMLFDSPARQSARYVDTASETPRSARAGSGMHRG